MFQESRGLKRSGSAFVFHIFFVQRLLRGNKLNYKPRGFRLLLKANPHKLVDNPLRGLGKSQRDPEHP